MTQTSKLPKTQAKAIEILADAELSRDAWQAAGANLNAIDALIRKGLVVLAGTVTQVAQGATYEAKTYWVAR